MDMSAHASRFAAGLVETGLALDFTEASLPRVDRLLALMKREIASAPTEERRRVENTAALNIGAYVGELLRREEGGVWTDGPNGVPVVDLGSHLATTVWVVLGLFRDGRIMMPDGEVTTVTAYYQSITTIARASLEAIVRGPHADLADLQRAMSADDELAAWLIVQAQLAVKTGQTKWGLPLDFTLDSLKGIENMLEALHAGVKSAAPEDRPTDDQVQRLSVLWGVYVGEVTRRQYGGTWTIDQPDNVLTLNINDAKVWPLRKVQKRIIDGPGDAIPFYVVAIGKMIASR
jgi:hypothetical protein